MGVPIASSRRAVRTWRAVTFFLFASRCFLAGIRQSKKELLEERGLL